MLLTTEVVGLQGFVGMPSFAGKYFFFLFHGAGLEHTIDPITT